jgi:hypothetical protein
MDHGDEIAHIAAMKGKYNNLYTTSCTRPRVAVAPSGATEEKEERSSPLFKYV